VKRFKTTMMGHPNGEAMPCADFICTWICDRLSGRRRDMDPRRRAMNIFLMIVVKTYWITVYALELRGRMFLLWVWTERSGQRRRPQKAANDFLRERFPDVHEIFDRRCLQRPRT
jgi:hypothetical protein